MGHIWEQFCIRGVNHESCLLLCALAKWKKCILFSSSLGRFELMPREVLKTIEILVHNDTWKIDGTGGGKNLFIGNAEEPQHVFSLCLRTNSHSGKTTVLLWRSSTRTKPTSALILFSENGTPVRRVRMGGNGTDFGRRHRNFRRNIEPILSALLLVGAKTEHGIRLHVHPPPVLAPI